MLRLYNFQERSVCCQYNSWSSIVIFSHEKDEWLCCYFDYYVISTYSFLKCAKSFSGWKLLHVLPQRDLNPFKIYRVTTNEWQQWCQCMACTTSTKNCWTYCKKCGTSGIFQTSFAWFNTFTYFVLPDSTFKNSSQKVNTYYWYFFFTTILKVGT